MGPRMTENDPNLILRRTSRDDFDVFDGERKVGQISRVDEPVDGGEWFWNLRFEPPGRETYKCGHVSSLDEAKAALRAAYLRWEK